MPIHVTTGGSLEAVPPLLDKPKATFQEMIVAIADDLDDSHNEYLAQIQAAIFSAIRFCEREAFYFNQNREIVFKTIAGQAIYDGMAHADIATLAGLSAVYCQKMGERAQALQPMPAQRWERLQPNGTSFGRPQHYNYFAQTLRLYPTPDDARYLIRLSLEPKRLSMPTSMDEDHPWFLEAFDLIKARAKYELYKNILQDASQAAASWNDFLEQLQALRAETSRRISTGNIAATVF